VCNCVAVPYCRVTHGVGTCWCRTATRLDRAAAWQSATGTLTVPRSTWQCATGTSQFDPRGGSGALARRSATWQCANSALAWRARHGYMAVRHWHGAIGCVVWQCGTATRSHVLSRATVALPQNRSCHCGVRTEHAWPAGPAGRGRPHIHEILKFWYKFSAAAKLGAWHARRGPVYYVPGLNAQGCSSRT
jgi:hypothetical protein